LINLVFISLFISLFVFIFILILLYFDAFNRLELQARRLISQDKIFINGL